MLETEHQSGSLKYNGVTGEPCAVKAASTVRGGAVRKGLPRYHQEAQRSSWQVGEAEDLAGRLLYSNRGPVVSV
jgi:hypothetical protein